MKTLFGSIITFLAVGVATASALESVKVQATSDFRLAVINTTQSATEDAALYQTFAVALAAQLDNQFGSPMKVKVVTTSDAQLTADKVLTGAFDAALVISDELPSAMSTPEFAVARACSGVGIQVKVFHFVVRSEDAALKSKATAAFAEAVAAPRFQEALNRAAAFKVTATVARR
jgi:hypothetical protein